MKILLVCLGNICRSPLAEGILRKKVADLQLDWEIDSAGTGSWHIGEQPHTGSIKIAADHGIDITDQKARQFTASDVQHYDLIIAMDSQNYQDIIKSAPSIQVNVQLKIMLNYLYPGENRSVPDPYFTGDFGEVYHLLDQACDRLIAEYIR